MQQVLQHHALDAGGGQLAQSLQVLVQRAGDGGVRELARKASGVGVLRLPLGQPCCAIEQLGAVLAG